MKSLITITLGTLLAITSAFGGVTIVNDVPEARYSSLTVVTLTEFSGTTYQGYPTNGTIWETNVVTPSTPATCANISLASGVVHVQLEGLNGYFPAFVPIATNQNLRLISKAGLNTVEFACFGNGWDIPATPDPSKSMHILSIVGAQQPGATKANSTSCGGPCGGAASTTPMASYRFHSLLASLSISDTPIAYAPPVGPAIGFSVVYNQKEAYQPTNWTYSNLGPKWNFSPISFIQDDTTNFSSVRCFVQGGGSEEFSGYNTNTGAYAAQMYSQSRLTRTSATGYERSFSDGSREVYDYPDSGTTNRRVFLTRAVDPSGNQVRYVYQPTANGTQLTQVIDAIGQTNTFAYGNTNDPLKVTTITDPFGRYATLSYAQTNGALRLVSITDPVLIVSQFRYSGNDFINALTTPYGTTAFTYSEGGGALMLTATDPYGATECLQYWESATIPTDATRPAGMLLDTNNLGSRNSYYWGKKAWSQGSNDVSKAVITHWAVQNSQTVDIPLYVKHPLENAVWFNYPGQTSVAGEDITSAQPSIIGRVLDDGTTQAITRAYDQFGNITNSLDAVGRASRFVYSTNGIDLLEAYQKNGAGWDLLASVAYNAQHLPTSATVAGVPSSFGYSTNGLLLKSTNVLGQVSTYNYNVKGFLTNVTGHLPTDTVDIAYDSAGRVFSVKDSQGYAITNAYDNIDRITNVALPDATTLRYVYDKLDLAQSKGRDNRWTYLAHDSNRKLTDVQNQAGHLNHFEWCGCGVLEAFTDPKGQTTVLESDLQSRPTRKLYADLSAEVTAYEARTSRVKSTTDTAGKKVTLAHATDDNVTSISYSGGLATPGVSFAYDTNYNRLTKMVDGIGTNTLAYVPAGQVAAGSVQSIDGPLANDTITVGYDAMGRPLTLQIGSASSSVQYDTIGRVWWSSNMLGITTVEYVGTTRRPDKVTRPNGLTSVFGYTPVTDGSRLQSMITTNGSGQVVESYGYSYDTRNLITEQTNVANGITTAWNYDYDLAQKLTSAIKTTNGIVVARYAYSYDKAGNRLTEQVNSSAATEQANNLNQVLSSTAGGSMRVSGFLSETGTVVVAGSQARMTTATNFTSEMPVSTGTNVFPVTAVDLSGNAVTNWYQMSVSANGVPTSFKYDKAGNLLVKANTAQTNAFGWDGADRCTAITNGSLRTTISYDGLSRWTRIQEFSGTNITADRRFVWNGNSLAEERDASGINVVKRFLANGFWQGGTNYYYLTDHLGSVIGVTLKNGTIVARFEYDPYGRRTGTNWVDFGFAGLFELPNGLKLAVWRIYDPSTGRWLSRDPIREDGGWNLYGYCHSDPVNFVDPTGLWDRWGLMEELLKSAQGKEALKLTKGKLFGINPFTITATTYADSTLTQTLTTKTFPAAGWTQLEPREVWLVANDEVSNADAAAYVIHEARHIWQLQNCPDLTTYQREVDAFTYVEVYRKQHSMPASKATFRNPDGTLNAKGIIEHVRNTYGDGTPSDAVQQKVIRQIPNLKGDNGKFQIR